MGTGWVDGTTTVRQIDSSDGKWSVEVVQRPDGLFGYQVFRWWTPDPDLADVVEPSWAMDRRSGVFETADAAEAEARATVPLEDARP